MNIEKYGVYIIMVLVGMSIAGLMMASVLIPRSVEAGSATKVTDKTAAMRIVGEPEITVRNKPSNGEFEYDVTAIMDVQFTSKTAEKITVFPVVFFKDAKERDIDITDLEIRKGETRHQALNFRVRSKKWPMIIKDNDNSFACTPDKPEDCVHSDQILLLKNFSFSFSTFQIDLGVKLGPCLLIAEIQCPLESRTVALRLENEDNTCQKEKDKENCSKIEKMCGALVSMELNGVKADEGILDRIKPGSPKCEDKAFVLSTNVGAVNENIIGSKFTWQVGEDISFALWEKSAGKELENCWRDVGKGCADFYLGEKAFTIPVESYR